MASLERLYNMKIFILWDWNTTLSQASSIINTSYAYHFEKHSRKDRSYILIHQRITGNDN